MVILCLMLCLFTIVGGSVRAGRVCVVQNVTSLWVHITERVSFHFGCGGGGGVV